MTLKDQSYAFDLGPTWYWPETERLMTTLIESLLPVLVQVIEGTMMLERSPGQVEQHRLPDGQTVLSHRLVNGMHSVTEALAERLHPGTIQLAHCVTAIEATDQVELTMEQSGSRIRQTFDHVIVTLPPRLSGLIQWRPALPESVHDQLRTTPTWMAGQAKVVAVYDIPFWRQAGHPIAVLYQDWAKKPEMAVKADAEPLTDFPDYRSIRLEGALQDKVTLLGT